jgi:hypothetical protein
LFEQIAQLDGRARFAIGIKRHGAIALANNSTGDESLSDWDL